MGWVKLKDIPGQKVDCKKFNFNYWKIEEGYVWHQGRKLRKADPDTFEIREEQSQIFIARDKNHIFHAWNLEKNIDRDTFEEVANGYWVDCDFAYCEHETSIKPLKGEDAKNFKFIGGPYARDSEFAYYGGRAIKTCKHPLDLKMVVEDNPWYAGDGVSIYYDGAEIKGADYSTWIFVEGGFSRDKNSVYFGSKKLPRVNVDNWEIKTGTYSSDGISIYHMNFKVKGADPNTWIFMDDNFSKDESSVFYCGTIIEGADPESFIVTGERSGKDKFNSYSDGAVEA